ncbi:MAG: LLM class flavin-dependent oxidoreductase [Candidatus Bathyarchaeia archaeon]
MKFGIHLPGWGVWALHPELYLKTAPLAEELGYEWIFTSDHFMEPIAPEPLPVERHATIEPYTLLAYIAAQTSKIKIGTCVTPLPMRYPPQLAKMVSQLDILSGGRMVLGIGAGYGPREWKAYSVTGWISDRERMERTEEALKLMISLWTQDRVDFQGKYYKIEGAVLQPKPIQKPHPPLLFGARGKRMLDLTARYGDFWLMSVILVGGLEEFKLRADYLKKKASEYGRTIKLGVVGPVIDEAFKAEIPILARFNEVAQKIEEFKTAGCKYLSLVFFPPQKFTDLMKRFRKEVMPSFT